MSPAEAIHGGLGCVQPGDVVIMVSRGGKTAELLPIIDVVNKKKATLIALTENVTSPLGLKADILLPMKIALESDPLNLMATASYMATVAIFDALLCALIVETDYTAEQFALIHPGGAVGEKLNQPQIGSR
jgi:D-arabinose 5-phosphate isomerase GutQ